MRKLIAVLAILAVPVAVAPPAHADVPCRAELYSIYADNLNEMDGKDELRFSIGGNLYPTVHKDWVKIASGKTKYSAAFERPSGLISTSTGSAIFSLREVTPPAAGLGTLLGTAVVNSQDCNGLAVGQTRILPTQFIEGNDESPYAYEVKLQVLAI